MIQVIPYLLTCGPLLLTLATWGRLYSRRLSGWPRPLALAALSAVSANAAYAATVFLYYQFRPSPSLPPWKDPETLDLALLFLTAPIGMILGLIAAAKGSPKWLVVVMEVASVPLLITGLLEGVSV